MTMERITKVISKTAIVTGLRGQDGMYLAEELLNAGYHVLGTSHDADGMVQSRLSSNQFELIKLDLTDRHAIDELIRRMTPDEVYNLAARSSSHQFFDDPLQTSDINGLTATRFLNAIKNYSPSTKFLQAGSSEIFAGASVTPQCESTRVLPINAYGVAKCYAMQMAAAYRETHGLFASTAILFNHESPLRSEQYVTKKIAMGAARIALKLDDQLVLQNLDSRRDWGFAGDYSRAMRLMLQQNTAQDFVIATGKTHSVEEFCRIAFSRLQLDYRHFVKVEPSQGRRIDRIELRGDASLARSVMGWHPSYDFEQLVHLLVDDSYAQLKREHSL